MNKQIEEDNEDNSDEFPKDHDFKEDFVSASELPQINQRLLDDYYELKSELIRLSRKEDEIKELIKNVMQERKIKYIRTDKLDIKYTKVIRTNYPKNRIEELVPREVLDKIIIRTEIMVLTTKIRHE